MEGDCRSSSSELSDSSESVKGATATPTANGTPLIRKPHQNHDQHQIHQRLGKSNKEKNPLDIHIFQ